MKSGASSQIAGGILGELGYKGKTSSRYKHWCLSISNELLCFQSPSMTDDMVVTTLSGQDITIDLDGGASIKDQSGADVAIALVDVQGTNGVIHVIETVLLPSL